MGKKIFGDYYLGLDIGTGSVGWAVTDMDYNVLRFNGNAMWGVRLFDDAKTAVDRRTARIARRRLERRHQRLALLQDLFADQIAKVDPSFFLRLNESGLHPADKKCEGKDSLFHDKGFTDRDYHKKYPTIYHLRWDLMNSTAPHDVRLVYLAIHHIIKSRGHFLFQGDLDSTETLPGIMGDLADDLEREFAFDAASIDVGTIAKILSDRDIRLTEKQKRLSAAMPAKDSDAKNAKRRKEFVKALSGAKFKIKDLFPEADTSALDKDSVDLGSDEYEAASAKYEAMLGEDFLFLEKLKAIYDWALLERTLHGYQYLSKAKVDTYEQHGKDLKLLKSVLRKYGDRAAYSAMFRDPTAAGNYCAYAGIAVKDGKKLVIEKRCTQEDFLKTVKKALAIDRAKNDPTVQDILARCDLGTFMPKVTTKDNGVIPYQLHYRELVKILENAAGYLPFLSEKDENSVSVSDKILQILTFRIPYYVGPLNNLDPHGKNTWVVRRSQEKIYPWNFDEIVDREASANQFMTRLTNDCTYLHGEKVLPKCSVLYSRFEVLNEINNLRIKGQKISVEVKQRLFNDLFMARPKVTLKAVRDFYKCAYSTEITDSDISGVDGGFKSSMRPAIEMRAILGAAYTDDIAEKAIYLVTVFADDRIMLKKRLQTEFRGVLPAGAIDAISKKTYSGWGRLSRRFLDGIEGTSRETGEIYTVIGALWNTDRNLMQILSDELTFTDAIRAENAGEGDASFSYKRVQDLYVSPSVKRQIWQALLVVKEIRKITGHDPKKVFIEMARGADNTGRKSSRKQKLLDLYRKCGEDARELSEELEKYDDSDLRQDKLYLYFTQMGRCMYSGAHIDLHMLMTTQNEIYNIDHIYPRSRTKDDSLNNRVLVRCELNYSKSDIYPLPQETRDAMKGFWSMLLDKGLIDKSKYDRLIRTESFSDQELASFIARQLVETRQTTKYTADLLKDLLPDASIVYSHAGPVSDFRRDYDMLKCREVNDLHHAKDAYLNIVVGNVYDTKFTRDPRNFFREKDHTYSLNHMFDFDVTRGGISAWKKGDSGTIATVKKTMRKNNILMTRMSYEFHGAMFKLNPKRKNEGQLSLHSSDPRYNDLTRYGGYDSVAGSYFMLVQHDVKGQTVRSIIDMPLHILAQAKTSKEILTNMLIKEKGLVSPTVLLPRIPVNALLEFNGVKMHLTSRQNDSCLFAIAHELIVNYGIECYIRKIVKYNERAEDIAKNSGSHIKPEPNSFDGINAKDNMALYELFIAKLSHNPYSAVLLTQAKNLDSARDSFTKLPLSKQCKTLVEILHLFACNRTTADLSSLTIKGKKLAGRAGVISRNRKITGLDSAYWINQSVTGLFEVRRDLLS